MSFIIGVFLGGILGITLMALLIVAAEEDKSKATTSLRSSCCDFLVEIVPTYRCIKCGKFCDVKDE